MEKPVFSTKIRYLPPPRNGRELIIRKSTLKEAKEQMDRHINEIVAKEAMISSSLNELNTIKANYHKMLTETQSEHTIMNEKKPKSR
jgi:peptidoglycan hydrolase CwlO-like protein